MYFLLNMVISQCHVSFQGFRSGSPNLKREKSRLTIKLLGGRGFTPPQGEVDSAEERVTLQIYIAIDQAEGST